MNYYVEIQRQDGGCVIDFFDTKRELVRWIAEETGMTQVSFKKEVEARADSSIYRDNKGYRIFITFNFTSFNNDDY
jgi:hypothetical protein